ncbi:MAG: hypothetical protein SVR08_00555 [Spirochaetota bacterium]|nr:hypothetical protein [Spirochaetota bacterium]
MTDKKKESEERLREFEENPYNPDGKKPEDVVRIFYINSISIIPVISRRGVLLGILEKEDVIAELSDIERVNNLKIDQFISKVARKMTLDEVLPYAMNTKEFIVINLFGEIHGKWTRLKLFAACEQAQDQDHIINEIEKQKEDQILEWMIYLILEHIPRALYAINKDGKTIFYNSYFEDLFKRRLKRDIDIKFVEDSLNAPQKNELFSNNRNDKETYFYNKSMKIYYEKAPLLSNGEPVGFLIFCDKNLNEESGIMLPGINMKGMSLKEMMQSIERMLIVESIIDNNYNLQETAKNLRISRQSLQKKVDNFGIEFNK